MNIVQVVPRIHEEASGPAYSVPRLSGALAGMGHRVSLTFLEPCVEVPAGVRSLCFPAWRFGWTLGISPAMRLALRDLAAECHIVHSHSIWMLPNVYPAQAVRGQTAKLVVSPRGTLTPKALSISAMRKRIFWALLQERAVRAASCLHATSENEYSDLRELGLRGQPVCVIPNGVDIPPVAVPREKDPDGRRKLVYLGRIHEKKGIDLLLRSWVLVQNDWPEWELDIVGPGADDFVQRLRGLGSSLGARRVRFCGPAYGEAKLAAYRDADLFVLPTYSENFGMVVAEALAAGTPAICTQGAPWSGLQTEGAGWWVEIGDEALAEGLCRAFRESPQALVDRGRMGREWMRREFSWDRVARQMESTYAWLLGAAERPSCVRLD